MGDPLGVADWTVAGDVVIVRIGPASPGHAELLERKIRKVAGKHGFTVVVVQAQHHDHVQSGIANPGALAGVEACDGVNP